MGVTWTIKFCDSHKAVDACTSIGDMSAGVNREGAETPPPKKAGHNSDTIGTGADIHCSSNVLKIKVHILIDRAIHLLSAL